jgi:hypothetical protein
MHLQALPINGLVFALQGGICVKLKHYWGSNEKQQLTQIHVFSQLTTLGQPSHFFNITPNSVNNHLFPS